MLNQVGCTESLVFKILSQTGQHSGIQTAEIWIYPRLRSYLVIKTSVFLNVGKIRNYWNCEGSSLTSVNFIVGDTAGCETSTGKRKCRHSSPGNSSEPRCLRRPYIGASLGTSDRGHSTGRGLPVVVQWHEQATGWQRDLWASGPEAEKSCVSGHNINMDTMYLIAMRQHKQFKQL
jgi:hypothetical protein